MIAEALALPLPEAGSLGPMDLLALSTASALGAACRYAVDRVVTRLRRRSGRDGRPGRAFPIGIAVVNLSGCLLVGLLAGWMSAGWMPAAWMPAAWMSQGGDATWLAVAQVGFVGSYTTFSTWVLDSLLLMEERPGAALLNLFGSLLGGLCAVLLGFLLAAG